MMAAMIFSWSKCKCGLLQQASLDRPRLPHHPLVIKKLMNPSYVTSSQGVQVFAALEVPSPIDRAPKL